MVIWHPADLVHDNNFISNGHNLNLVIEPEWLEGLPTDTSLPDGARSWDGGLPYRIGLELYRSLNRDAQISDESVFNLISLCASSKPVHGQTRWLPLILDWMNDEYSCTLTLSQASKSGWRSSSPCVPKFPAHAGLHVPRVSHLDSYPQSHGYAEAIRNLHNGDCLCLRL